MRVAELFVYPVKSLRGVALKEARVGRRGLLHDRHWMVVDDAGGALTQRALPAMARINTAIDGDRLRLFDDDGAEVAVPIAEPSREAPRRTVTIWRDTCEAIDCGAEVAAWLGARLGVSCALVVVPEDGQRAVPAKFGEATDRIGFADAFPFLLATTASLEDLNRRMEAPLPMARFRPNVVVEGARAFEEDRWARLRIGGLGFRAPKGCDRCVVTTTDQRTGELGVEPLKTLATFRKWDGAVWFGRNLIHDAEGVVRVGDAIEHRGRH